jgi:NAD(P)-dependent dehydrogenase (short-subunit alcohol dehydrogenase family)
MGRLAGKVAIVTGAGNGMGRETAILFAREGAAVAVTDVQEDDGRQTLRLIEQAGGKARFWPLNVSRESEVEKVFADVAKTFGRIDVLVNNAGITGVDKPIHEVSEQEWDAVFAVDVKGVFFGTKHAIPYMKRNGGGSIVNLSSIYGLVGSHELPAYHAAKGAVTLMTKQTAVVYGRDRIRINAIHPGTILTPLVRELGSRGEGGLEAYLKLMAAKHPIGHAGEPHDVAYAILFLASNEARFITGASLAVDGGYTAV